MTTINLSDTHLQVRFTPLEKVAGLVRDLDVPRPAAPRPRWSPTA